MEPNQLPPKGLEPNCIPLNLKQDYIHDGAPKVGHQSNSTTNNLNPMLSIPNPIKVLHHSCSSAELDCALEVYFDASTPPLQ